VAIGPAAATLDPVEVSTLHVVQSFILRLLAMLPRRKVSTMLAEEYNRVTLDELTNIRDYQALRYALASRSEGIFWENLAQAKRPESLQGRIDLFRDFGRFARGDHQMLRQADWVSSFLNFGFWPSSYDPIADMIDEKRMKAQLERFRKEVQEAAE
jgi:tryptophan halogenase